MLFFLFFLQGPPIKIKKHRRIENLTFIKNFVITNNIQAFHLMMYKKSIIFLYIVRVKPNSPLINQNKTVLTQCLYANYE